MEEYKKNLMRAALNFLTLREGWDDLLEQSITGDKSWIQFYEPEGKSMSMV